MENTDIQSQIDIDELQNMLIRYLLRNIYFLESCKRTAESDIVLSTREIEILSFVGMNNSLKDALNIIIRDKEYNDIIQSITRAKNRKHEISKILNHYK